VSRNVTEWISGGRIRPVVSLGLLVAAVYGAALGFDFVRWDDPVNITHNPLLQEPWSRDLLAKLVNGDTALRFKPLVWLLYRATYSLCGFNPAAWHALNLALHFAAVAMTWAVCRALLARLKPETPAAARAWLAWLAAAGWAVHPAHVEAAVWATATPYPLMVFFLLGSFLFYIRATDPVGPAANADFFRAWLLALLAYASYPVGVTYGAWLMVADLWIFRVAPLTRERRGAVPAWLARHALFLLPAVASVLVTFKSSSTTPWLYPAPATLAEVDAFVRLKMGAAMLGAVWTHFAWPFGLTPNNPILPAAMVHGPMILAMAALPVSLGLVAAAGWRKRPGFAAVFFGSTVLALPVLGFTQWPTWSVADRHVYLPHLVFGGALAVWLAGRPFAVRRTGAFTGAALLLVAGLAGLGFQQVLIWRNTDSLFRYIAAQPAFTWNPTQQAYICQLWGAQLAEDGQPAAALGKHTQARRIFQESMFGEAERGRWDEAVELSRHLEQSYGLPPRLRRERVRWLLHLGRRAEAQADLAVLQRELPGDGAVEQLEREWRRQDPGNHL
jgi:hypothetical protein